MVCSCSSGADGVHSFFPRKSEIQHTDMFLLCFSIGAIMVSGRCKEGEGRMGGGGGVLFEVKSISS